MLEARRRTDMQLNSSLGQTNAQKTCPALTAAHHVMHTLIGKNGMTAARVTEKGSALGHQAAVVVGNAFNARGERRTE